MNRIICKNCMAENPFYELTCRSCKAYIRERVVNIDFWKILARLIEIPRMAFSEIIHAEHKNLLYVVITLSALKMLLTGMVVSPVISGTANPFEHFIRNFFLLLSILILILILSSAAMKIFLKLTGDECRFRDNLAVLSYSMMPHVLGLVILFPMELVVFGGFLFSNNPSPFTLKETVAYILLGFEMFIIIWQLFLTTTAFYVQTGRLLYALIFSLIFNSLLYYILYLFTYLII